MISTVIMRSFEREKILERLAVLSSRNRAAYALACAERLMPLYWWFQEVESWGDRSALEKGVEIGWRWVKGEQIRGARIAEAARACEDVTPDTEDFASPLASRALDAASAVAQALEACISPLPETAVDAGEIAWECAFGIEQSRLLEAGAVHFANRQYLQRAAQGGFVSLEEDLQQRSLQWLERGTLTGEESEDFRKKFAQF
jgi:uncharacterized protein YjaG (DUF416 family)